MYLKQIFRTLCSLNSKYIYPLSVVVGDLNLRLGQLDRLLLILKVVLGHLLVFVHVKRLGLENCVHSFPGSVRCLPAAVEYGHLAGEVALLDSLREEAR